MQLAILGELPGRRAQAEMAAGWREKLLAENPPTKSRDAAVLALLTPVNKGHCREALLDWHVLLIRRSRYPGVHSGQIALPGGKYEKDDAGLWDTACREAWEEVGLAKDSFAKSGALSALYVPASSFVIHPFIAVCTKEAELKADPREVVEYKNVPMHVFDPDRATTLSIRAQNGAEHVAPAWQYNNFTVWGATAMILAELYRLIDKEILVRSI